MNKQELEKLDTPHITIGRLQTDNQYVEVWSVSADAIWLVTVKGAQHRPDFIGIQELDLDSAKGIIKLLTSAIEICEI